VALRFVFNSKSRTLAAGKLFGAGLFRIEMIKTWLARDQLAIFSDSQSLAV
jgi:hypothetical protein